MNNLSLKTSSKQKFLDVIKQVKSLLEEQSFGVLSDINITKKIQKKIGENIDKYRILGACNPEFAYNVLKENKSIGLFLPCSIVIYKEEDRTVVEIMQPTFTDQVFDNERIAEVSKEVEENLKYVIKNIE